jgi:hypothetical protein
LISNQKDKSQRIKNNIEAQKFFDKKQLASINKYKQQTEEYIVNLNKVQEKLVPIESPTKPLEDPNDIRPHPDYMS